MGFLALSLGKSGFLYGTLNSNLGSRSGWLGGGSNGRRPKTFSSQRRLLGEVKDLVRFTQRTAPYSKRADQQPINNRSTKPKKTGDLDGRIDQQPTNNRPTTDRLIDKTKKDQEDQEDRKSSTSPLEPYVLLWNSTLHPLGYGKCEKITPKRIAALSARLRQDPEYFTTFSRAVDYLSRDEWWRGKAKQFTIDLLIDQAGRAQELSEKTPSAPSVKSYNSRTADIDEVFIKQMQALGYN